MSSVLAMFPGQGSQFVGMGREGFSLFAEIFKTTFEEAEDTIQVKLRRLCLEGPESDLKLTANTQPCIVATSVAVWRALVAESGLTPALFAGHSLGEYSALVASGKMRFPDAIRLVRHRGEAMQRAVPEGLGGMAAVMGIAPGKLDDCCARHSRDGLVVTVANYNSPQQLVVSGHLKAVESLCAALETEGFRSVLLPVSAPFHSPLMRPARDAMAPLLRATVITNTPSAVIPNLTGKPVDQYVADMLIDQIDHPVRWIETLETAHAAQCVRFIEVGPGKVLMGLARRVLPRGIEMLATDDLQDGINRVKAWA